MKSATLIIVCSIHIVALQVVFSNLFDIPFCCIHQHVHYICLGGFNHMSPGIYFLSFVVSRVKLMKVENFNQLFAVSNASVRVTALVQWWRVDNHAHHVWYYKNNGAKIEDLHVILDGGYQKV